MLTTKLKTIPLTSLFKDPGNLMIRLIQTLLFIILFTVINSAYAATIAKQSQKLSGFYNLYYQQSTGSVFVEIKHLNQPFLYQTSLVQGLGSNDVGLDRGRLADTKIVHWERHGNKVFLKQNNLKFRANTKDANEAHTIDQAFADSVIWGGTIAEESKSGLLVDVSSLILSDRQDVIDALAYSKQGAYHIDSSRSAIAQKHTKAFPKNTEISAWITYTSSKAGNYVSQAAADGKSFTLLTRHSFVALPDSNYKPRAFHPYSGYWAVGYQDYASPIEKDMNVQFIPRHRLAKKFPEKAKSEAVEPIIYYLDAGTPEPVRSALLEGARWWNQAFEAAGYIDAFQVKMLPDDADPMDARYNVIQWVHRATRGWSYGASVIDPRTGEIIKGHVTLGSLRVRQDLLIARGLSAAFATNDNGDQMHQQMALDRIKQLSAHEVGHTLGIAHNFAASGNDRASVMDYPAPFVTLNENIIDFSNAYDKGIGEWDKQVIKYGYSDFSDNDDNHLKTILQESRARGLRYLSDPDSRSVASANPVASLWDNGSDPVEELTRLSTLRKHALASYSLSNIKSTDPMSDLQETLVPIYLLHRFQVQAAAKVIGGIDYGYWLKEDEKVKQIVSMDRQRKALEHVLDTLSPEYLTLPSHLFELMLPKAYGDSRNRESFPSNNDAEIDALAIAEVSARHTLTWLLNPQRLNRVLQNQVRINNPLTVDTIIEHLISATLNSDKFEGDLAQVHQRINFVVADKLIELVHDKSLAPEIKAELDSLIEKWCQKKAKVRGKGTYQKHYLYLAKQLLKGLSDSSIRLIANPAVLPPGSPI